MAVASQLTLNLAAFFAGIHSLNLLYLIYNYALNIYIGWEGGGEGGSWRGGGGGGGRNNMGSIDNRNSLGGGGRHSYGREEENRCMSVSEHSICGDASMEVDAGGWRSIAGRRGGDNRGGVEEEPS